jgi:cell division protein FtsW (lipid II flippase)
MILKLLNAVRPLLRPNPGWFTLAAALGLTLVGLMAIQTAKVRHVQQRQAAAASADSVTTADSQTPPDRPVVREMLKQGLFMAPALIVMVGLALPHHRRLVVLAYPLLIVTLIMLVIVLLPFMPREIVPVRNGARRWFNLQFILFQPSELAKIAYVLTLAVYLRFRENYRTFTGLLLPLLITFIPMGLILVEPDLGTAMIFLPVFFAMLIAAGARLKHLLLLIVIGLSLLPAMYPLLEPHQKARINDVVARMTGDSRHEQDISFQGKTATRLVGSGQLLGNDSNHAADLIYYNRLPEPHNDMIFAVIVTRWGMAGGAVVLGLYLLLMASALVAAGATRDPFARLVAVGIVAVVFTQMFVNIGMTIGLLPITGMTLPFVSYGGSSLLTNYAMVGLLLNVAARRPIIMAHPSFEFDQGESTSIGQRSRIDNLWGARSYSSSGTRVGR